MSALPDRLRSLSPSRGGARRGAQDRLTSMPGYERYQRMAPLIQSALGRRGRGFGARLDGQLVDRQQVREFDSAGKRYRFDVADRRSSPRRRRVAAQSGRRPRARRDRCGRRSADASSRRPSRRRAITARSTATATSGSAIRRGASAIQITTDGSEQARVKYGTASWVYGEELSQRTAMWWSPDGKKLAFYRFDESKVPDFYLTPNLTQTAGHARRRGVSEAGRAQSGRRSVSSTTSHRRQTTHVDVRDGKPFDERRRGLLRVSTSAGRPTARS